MKQGGVSWNASEKSKRGVQEVHACEFCGRKYKMKWAKNNHQKLCEQKEQSKK